MAASLRNLLAERNVVIAIVAAAAIYSLSSLWLPMGWDHGIMASVGKEIARGGLPYRDAWDIKGPMAYLPYGLSTLIFGSNMWGMRIIEILILIPCFWFIARALAVRTSLLMGVGAVVACHFWLASQGWFFSAQPDIWVAVSVAVAVLMVRPETLKARTLLISGALVGCAALVKPFFAGFGLSPLLVVLMATGFGVAHRARLAAWLFAGALAPVIVVVGYIAALGGLPAMIEGLIAYNLGTYVEHGRGMDALLWGSVEFFVKPHAFLCAMFAAAGLWSLRRERIMLVSLFSWLVMAWLVVVVQGKYFPYHWFVLYPPLVFAGALGLNAVFRDSREGMAAIIAVFAALTFLAGAALTPARSVLSWAKYMVTGMPVSWYSGFTYWTYNAHDELEAVRYLETSTAPEEGVFVWGNDATITYLLDRPNPSRFVFNMPLLLEGEHLALYRAETLQALELAPPKYIVVGTGWRGEKHESVPAFPEFQSLLATGYTLETTIGYLDIYRRNGS